MLCMSFMHRFHTQIYVQWLVNETQCIYFSVHKILHKITQKMFFL